MRIAYFEIQNFRKLKSCRVEIGERETLLIGANNSGKTSAIEAFILFLKKERNKEIVTTDFTLSNWHELNAIGHSWVQSDDADFIQAAQLEAIGGNEASVFYLDSWRDNLPTLDLWLDVNDAEIHYVSHLIPTLSWKGGLIGVRLILEPKINDQQQVEGLYKDFRQAFKAAESAVAAFNPKKNPGNQPPKLWPQTLREFLDKKLHTYFTINAYLLDPARLEAPVDGVAKPQKLSGNAFPISSNPFDGLFKLDVINAQRGFSDPNSSDSTSSSATSLSSQFRSYYDKHLNPSELPEPEDIDALSAIEEAKNKFDVRLKNSFQSAITELETMGYPGFSDPTIFVTTDVKPIDGLAHDSAVQFRVDGGNQDKPLALPEKYNGLGYQNLVSMVFRLIRYRDEWMRVGKAGKQLENAGSVIEPLHLVLIEEPEAHLHAQVQQVFIKNAYKVLRGNNNLKDSDKFTTQLVLSTHSSHIAHEVNFTDLRYFRRLPAISKKDVPCASLVNLSETFGDNSDTSKFAARYLKTTHCDLFFADAVILVEGPAERMLVPHFIKARYCELDSRYITVLEIGGSHAHRLQPLIEKLGIFCLVITDLDSVEKPDNERAKKIQPARGKGYLTGNDTLKRWLPKIEILDDLLDCTEKVSENGLVCVSYPATVSVAFTQGAGDEKTIPYTFEDALALDNIELFKNITVNRGLIKKIKEALSAGTIDEACKDMFEALGGSAKKAEMALELLFLHEPSELVPPQYIAEGLVWLQDKLKVKDQDFITTDGDGHDA